MNKIVMAGLAALALTTVAGQQAQAWSKYNFGVGLNVGWEGGGNSVLWGLFKGANVPGAGMGGDFGGGGVMPAPGPGYQGFSGYNPYPFTPGRGAEPPLAAPTDSEKIPAPTPLKPAVYNPYQQMGYYPQMYQTVPTYSGYPAYPYYPAYTGYTGYTGYYGR